LKESNPGSIAFVERSEGRFLRLFVAFKSSLKGFTHCTPLLGIDGTHLKGKYLGVLLAATGVDAEGSWFPVAFAVVNAENDENWTWFLQNLKIGLLQEQGPRELTFLSDRQKGIVDGVSTVFGSAYHGFCMRHLVDNFKKTFKNPILITHLWQAAYASNAAKFEAQMLKIAETSPEAEKWLRDTNATYWANAHFPGQRYGHYTSNIAESVNSWILEAREKPVLHMMETIRRQLMKWFVERNDKGKKPGILVSFADKEVTKAMQYARHYQILPATDTEFECISENTTNIVKLQERTCTCRNWQQKGIPCAHASSAILFKGEHVHYYVQEYFKLEAYRQCYGNPIHPVPDKSLWNENDEIGLLPPNTRRPPGRPKKRRIRTEDIGRVKRIFKCSRCGGTGHSRITCREPTS
jgi:hypothetical protein